jgi:Soluble lytic murein transglycosylase and related regulatory proteins (some contain LysM/invasin domains)
MGLTQLLSPIPAQAEEKKNEPEQCLYSGPAGPGAPPACIRRSSYHEDLCTHMEAVALRNSVPPDFFARLIWRESLFKPDAVSPKGAEGIAQFMPATAKLKGLQNSFNPVEALTASAAYLKELKDRFGNFGLAAAAYNSGEAGAQRFLSSGALPLETRDYVFAITGHTAETWKTSPPADPAPALDKDKPFHEACVDLARRRSITEPILASADWAPWGVQLAAHYNPSVASRLFTRSVDQLPKNLKDQRALIVRQRGGNFGRRPRYAARIGMQTRAEANDLCGQIKAAGVPCTVFRNR